MMKNKLFAMGTGLAMAGLLAAGCGESEDQPARTMLTFGALPTDVIEAQVVNEMAQWDEDEAGVELGETDVNVQTLAHYQLHYLTFNTVSDMISALNGGRISAAYLPLFVSEYLLKLHPEYTCQPDSWYFCGQMALPAEKAELRDRLNKVLAELKADGTIARLIEAHVKNGSPTPAPASLPHFEGAETVKVGITGGLPPLDYMTTGGEIAGFNLALLTQIAQKAQINFVPVVVEYDSWPLGMKTGKIDLMFWLQSYNNPLKDAGGLIFTSVFIRDVNVYVTKKDFPYPDFWSEYNLPEELANDKFKTMSEE